MSSINNKMLLFLMVSAAIFVHYSVGQSTMIPQCTCAKVEQCKGALVESAEPCFNQCKNGLSSLGDVEAIHGCVQPKYTAIQSTISCVQSSYSKACAQTEGNEVRKRQMATMKLALSSKVLQLLRAWGVSEHATSLLGIGNHLFGCMSGCMTARAGHCEKNCGLDLPSDNVVINQVFQCATQNGFDTASMQSLCHCLVGAGISALQPICSKINMSVAGRK